jgi:predicted ATPase with chaperone activity
MTPEEKENLRLKRIIRRSLVLYLRAVDLAYRSAASNARILRTIHDIDHCVEVTDKALKEAMSALPLCRLKCTDSDVVRIKQWYDHV